MNLDGVLGEVAPLSFLKGDWVLDEEGLYHREHDHRYPRVSFGNFHAHALQEVLRPRCSRHDLDGFTKLFVVAPYALLPLAELHTGWQSVYRLGEAERKNRDVGQRCIIARKLELVQEKSLTCSGDTC